MERIERESAHGSGETIALEVGRERVGVLVHRDRPNEGGDQQHEGERVGSEQRKKAETHGPVF